MDRHKFVLTVQELLKRDDLESIRHGIRFNVSNFLARDDDAEEFLCKMVSFIFACNTGWKAV